MEMTTCQACHATIKANAKICPQCDVKVKREISEGFVLTMLLVGAFFTIVLVL